MLEEVIIVSVALPLTAIGCRQDYIQVVEEQLAAARRQGAAFACLPGGSGLAFFLAGQLAGSLSFGPAVEELVRAGSGHAAQFRNVHRSLAREAGLYLVSGSTWELREDRIVQMAYLLGPNGEELGWQAATSFDPVGWEQGWGRGRDVGVIPTRYGPVGLIVGNDAWHPEVGRILALLGARILFAPAMVPASRVNPYLPLAGLWQVVQQNQVFALENWLEGELAGETFVGYRSGYGPCEATPGETGFLRCPAGNLRVPGLEPACFPGRRQGHGDKDLFMVHLNFPAAARAKARFPVFKQMNPTLYYRYFGPLGEELRTSGEGHDVLPRRWQAIPQAFLRYLKWRCRPERIRSYLDGKGIVPADNLLHIDRKRIRVASVQLKLELIDHPLDYVEEMWSRSAEAVEAGAQVIAFPEDNAFQLLGLLPGARRLAESGLFENLTSLAMVGRQAQVPGILPVAGLFAFLTPVTQAMYLTTFEELARRFRVYIMGGSILVGDEAGRVVNRAYLFGPDGLVGYQDKTHLLPLESSWGLSMGDEIRVFDTVVGRIGLPICMDATYFETFSILACLGCDIALLPIANPEQYNHWKALRGIWPRVQESAIYGVKSAMVARRFFGLEFTGVSGVYGPLELTAGSGVLSEAGSPQERDLVLADLNLEALTAFRHRRLPVNRQVYAKYLPDLYRFQNYRWPDVNVSRPDADR